MREYRIFILCILALVGISSGCVSPNDSQEAKLQIGHDGGKVITANVSVIHENQTIHQEKFELRDNQSLKTVFNTGDPKTYNVLVQTKGASETLVWRPSEGEVTGVIEIRENSQEDVEIVLIPVTS